MSGEHARLAPSSADMWGPGGCPASVAMQERQPPQEETEANREGTAAHWLLEQILLKLPVADDAIAPNGVPINDEMREAVKELVVDVNDTLKACQSGDYFQVEQRVAAPGLIHPDNWGTPDVFFVQHSRKTLHVWDFKYGHRFVDVLENWQLVNYAAAIIETEQIVDWADWTFTFTIAQPRCFVRDELGGPLREWFTDGKRLATLIEQLRNAAADAAAPDALCRTGQYCLDCTAAWDCEAQSRAGGAAMHFATAQQSLRMDGAAIGLELTMVDDAEAILKARRTALEAKAQQIMNSGQSVAHHRIDWTKPRLGWAKETVADAVNICAMFGVDVQPGIALPTPTAVIKQGVDEAVITPYTFRPPASQKVVRVADNAAAKVFGRRD